MIGKTPLQHIPFDISGDDDDEVNSVNNDIFKQIIVDGVLTSIDGTAIQVGRVI
ncbi:hypothetical protein SAMD00019534_006170 [Acytostelium subglobosum LB1]|uniref:hypothetical protein n=1 Tax=Acytostelium subglobosum LB1 TaxID=1410327 RepID=UPI000644F3CB|nr:hypothetical protein SAMD00019534_006170 [Acytostelium subglobosum LB1]GAM17442.1 hypothetical protein SAMD00019534_006170 [Acytostelium subglobosum LB1]|eukprot:XP_012759504.1 hypothetical protein SAMD00019534_006170 [Acytostelium subglobosum LB1]